MRPFILQLNFSFNATEDTLYPVILKSEDEMILVDCGYPEFLPKIEEAAAQHGLSLGNLTGIIISHHDMDHMGGLRKIKNKYPSVKVYSSAIDKPFINGSKKSQRLEQAERLFSSLPDDQKPGALAFQQYLKTIRPVEVDITFADGEETAFLPGVQIIYTPGHMPGHISLYLKETKTLIACDAVVYQDGALDIANPGFTIDLPEAIRSVKKLQNLEINQLVCYHGGLVNEDIQGKIGELLRKYSES